MHLSGLEALALLGLHIMYWICKECQYWIQQHALSEIMDLPPFANLVKQLHTCQYDSMLGQLPNSWLELIAPTPGSAGMDKPSGKLKSTAMNTNPQEKGWPITNTQ
jgi:hypothetical protein